MRAAQLNRRNAARTLVWLLAAAVIALSVMMAREAFGQAAGVCGRTSQVSAAIAAASGAGSCASVTPLHLRDVTSLDLSGQGISSLSAGDFEGLVRLRTLDLSDNSLTSLPEGVFDELLLLRTLRLDRNELTTVPRDIIAQLFLLEELSLSGNSGLSLPDGMFDDFSRFDGMQSSGELAADTGEYPRISRFLTKHGITNPEEFIAALSPLYKERFTMVYRSKAAARLHVSGRHPRIISFGGDGGYTFAWNTDPDAPSEFLDTVEFLRQNDDDWTTGVIDFSGETATISEPAFCQVCHGSLNKPLWGMWNEWKGTEFVYLDKGGHRAAARHMSLALESSDQRIEPLDFSASAFPSGSSTERFLTSPGRRPYVPAVGEAGAVWSWRHAEVLFRRLKAQHQYFLRYAEELTCSDATYVQVFAINEEFDQRDHNLFVQATIEDSRIEDNGLLANRSDLVRYSYYYQLDGSIADALNFLALVELWQEEPIVRKLYRDTSNEDTFLPEDSVIPDMYLYYDSGAATAEDELIQKLRLHFGQGSRAALDARAAQNEMTPLGIIPSASFWDGHAKTMRPRVCDALRNSEPENLQATLNEGVPVLDWDAPTHDADSITGYRILRGVEGETPSVHVASTGTTDTAWTDENPAQGSYIYAVQTIYDGYYLSRESEQALTTVPPTSANNPAAGAPTIGGEAVVGETLTANATDLVDADGMLDAIFHYQWVRAATDSTETDIADATTSTYTLVDADEGKTVKVKVSFTDDGGNEETLTSAATAEVEPRPNRPAVGAPTVNGAAQVGKVVTADTSGITDEDRLTGVSFTYQWVRNDGADDADIPGAAGSAYTLVDADEGKTIKVRVTFTDDAGNGETLTSAATAEVEPRPNRPAGGAPTVNGAAQVGKVVTADTSGITDEDRLTSVAFTYQWVRNDGTDDADIPGATGSAYTLVDADEGKTVKVKVSFTDDGGNEETLTSLPTEPVKPAAAEGSDPDSTKSGAIDLGDITGLDKARFPRYTIDGVDDLVDYLRFTLTEPKRVYLAIRQLDYDAALSLEDDEGNQTRAKTKPGTASEAIARVLLEGTYYIRVDAVEEGENNYMLRYGVSQPDPGKVAALRRAANHPSAGAPTIAGTAQVGEMLTADTAGITDADGMANVTFSFQWIANDGNADTDIQDATGPTYEPSDDVVGKTIKVRVSFTDDAGNQESLTGEPTPSVTRPPLTASLENIPGSHNGTASFTFEIRFSEEFKLSFKTLRNEAFTVTGGSVKAARRLDKPSSIHWQIVIEPDSAGDATVVLPATTDCAATGAICTEDDRPLSNRLEFTVIGE